MSFDTSRFTFDPRRNFGGVVMEQGRPQLDSDWNEWLAEIARRTQAGALDMMGPAAYPINITPNAFQISASGGAGGNQITIGAGRYYVDGLLAENHGPLGAEAWDPALGELSGAPLVLPPPNVVVNYLDQPHYPSPPPIGNGPYLAYLDVWQREVTYLEAPHLIDKAVGVDTSGRLQTVWQVKLQDLSGIAGAVDCSTDIPAFDSLTQPSAARLTNGYTQSTPSGPCCLASNTGYTGLENQLYRVEIHKGGAAPTFKWSRDNASVGTTVTGIATVVISGANVSQLMVTSLGRDQVLGFNNGDWVEVTDDYRELAGEPGELHQITGTGPGLLLTLDSVIGISLDPTTASRHTRITRWDQQGTAGQGDIPVPLDGSAVTLEDGITVNFGLVPATGTFYSGDYWIFAARTADGSIEPLASAPPRGIHHHYAKLGIVTFPSTTTDCRVAWPPSSNPGCCCTVAVLPSDITATNTLDAIFGRYENLTTQTEICLAPGTYTLANPLRLTAAHSNISIKGCDSGLTVLQAQPGQEKLFSDGLLVLDNVSAINVQGLQFKIPAAPYTAAAFAGLALTALDPDVASLVQGLAVGIGIRMVNCSGISITGCLFDLSVMKTPAGAGGASSPFGAGIFASGACSDLTVADNQFTGGADFTTGLLHAPAVSFAPPVVIDRFGGLLNQRLSPGAGVLKNVVAAGAQADAAAAHPDVEKKAVAPAELESLSAQKADPALDKATTSAVSSLFNQSALNAGTNTPQLAANGGSVLPSTLSGSVIDGNSFSGLTVAALLLGDPGVLTLETNQVTACTAGFWHFSPLQIQALLYDNGDLIPLGALIAMSFPLPQGDATKQVTVAPAASTRVYAGKSAFTDNAGNAWTPDSAKSSAFSVSGGALNQPVTGATITDEGGATDPNPALYQSERYAQTFTYTFSTLATGYYQVTLKFAEITWKAAGIRIFDVSINDQQVLSNFDVFADSGGADIADDKVFPNIAPDPKGNIVVVFTGTSQGKDDNAKISAIAVEAQWDGQPSLGTQESELQNFLDQLAQLAEQAYAGLQLPAPQLRVDGNEMTGLIKPALIVLGEDSVANANVTSLMMTRNRLTSTIQGPEYARLYAFDRMVGAAENLVTSESSSELAAIIFLCTVSLVQISQCLVSGNIVVSDGSFRRGLYLNDALVATPQIMVNGNVFSGALGVIPLRYPADTTVPAPMNSWNFLNTVINS
jgi:hypothetical protein